MKTCVDMCVNMCVDMCVDMCTCMCTDMWTDMFTDICGGATFAFRHMSAHMPVHMSAHMPACMSTHMSAIRRQHHTSVHITLEGPHGIRKIMKKHDVNKNGELDFKQFQVLACSDGYPWLHTRLHTCACAFVISNGLT